jgi:hypothetical protein
VPCIGAIVTHQNVVEFKSKTAHAINRKWTLVSAS